MFNQVTIHRCLTHNKFDLGLLGETLLFYKDVLLLLDRGSLQVLLDVLDKDTIIRLHDEFGLKLSYHRDAFGTLTNTKNGLSVHNFSDFRIGGTNDKKIHSVKEEIEDVILRKCGQDRANRQFAKNLIDRTSSHILKREDAAALIAGARADIADQAYARDAAIATISLLAPSASIDQGWRFRAIDLGNDGFVIDSNIDFSAVNSEYRKVQGQEDGTLNKDLVASYMFSTRADAYFASMYMSGYVCDSISSMLMKRKFLELIRRRERDVQEIDLFQEHLFKDGKNIRLAVNNGNVQFSDLLDTVSKGRKFKAWLANGNPDESLLGEYVSAITQAIWIESLPGKTLRWVTTGGLGIAAGLAFSPFEGALASLGIGAVDTYLVERLLKGWRPDQFVEGNLMNII